MDSQERKILTAGELKQMFQDPNFVSWAYDLDRRADEYVLHEKANEARSGSRTRPQGFLRNEY